MKETAAKTTGSGGIIAAAFAVWAVILLAAFFAYRGSDVGQLPNLIGNIGGGPLVGDTGISASFAGFCVSTVIYLAWLGTGLFVYRLLRFEIDSIALAIAICTASGAAIWSLIWFFLGLAGVYYPSVALTAAVIGTLLFFVGLRPVKGSDRSFRFWSQLSGVELLTVALIGFVLAISLIGALAPPTAKDTLLYHFALPKTYVAEHGLFFVEGNIASYLALGNEMHSVWGMLLGGLFGQRAAEAAAGGTSFILFPMLLLATYGSARELKLERRWSLLATLMVASIPTAFHVASSSYMDLALALYVTLAIFALCRWWHDQKGNQLALIAIFLGAALSIKLTAVFVFAAFALIVLLRARKDKARAGGIVLHGFAALLLAVAIASPWYLRTWKAAGSPVYPFYLSIWKGEAAGWDVERSNLFQAMNSQYGGAEKVALDYLLSPVKLSVIAQPEEAQYFDGVIGVAFLIGLPLLVWGLWKFELPVEVKIGSGVAGIIFVFWLFSSQQVRYLLPILPVLAIGIVAASESISASVRSLGAVAQLSMGAAAIAGMLVSVAWFLQVAPPRVVLGGETRDDYLARNLDYYSYYKWLNTGTPPDAKVWLIDMRRDTYNLDRPVFSDYLFEDWTLRRMVWESRNVQELKAKAAAMGVMYVLTRHDFLFDYNRSTIVDDKKPRSENESKLRMTKDLILDPANTIRSDNKFSLIKVF